MICPDAVTLLEQRPLGLLDTAEVARLEAHLADCAVCRAEAVALDAVHAELSTVGLPMTLPVPLRDRVINAMDNVYTEDALAAKSKGLIVAELDHEAVAATAKKISLACSYCHDRTQREELVFCAGCLAPHHEECFAEHGRCSMPGCEELLTVRPGNTAAPRRRGPGRRWRLGVLSLGALACGVGAAAYSSLELSSRDAQMHKAMLERELEEQAALPDGPRAEEGAGSAESSASSRGSLSKLGGFLGSKGGKRGTQPRLAFAKLDLQVDQVPLREVVARIAAVSEVGISVDSEIDNGSLVSIDLREIPWTEALSVVARQQSCVVERLAGGSLLVSQPPKVTLQFHDANVRTVIQLLAQYAGKSVVLGSDVTGSVSPDFQEVPWDAALLAVTRATDLHLSRVGDVVQVTARPIAGARPFELTTARAWLGDYSTERGLQPVTLTLSDVPLEEAVARLQEQVPLTLMLETPGSWGVAGGGAVLGLDLDEEDEEDEEFDDLPAEDETLLPGERFEQLLVERCSLNLSNVGWQEALDALCYEAKLWQDRCGKVVYLRPRETNRLRASKVDIRVWLQAVAAMGNANIVVGNDVQGSLDYVDLSNASYRAALLATANSLGLRVDQSEGGVYEFRAGPQRDVQHTEERPQSEGVMLGGHTFHARAVLLGALDAACVLNDRSYAFGDSLIDPASEESDELSGFAISGIYPDRVEVLETTNPDEPVTHVLLLD